MKKILFCLLSVLAFVACSDDFMSFGNGENLVFTATIDNPQTRTSIARETGKVSWVEGDVILINGVEYVAHPDGDNASTAIFTKRDENAANPVKNGDGNYVATYGDVENQIYSPDGANCPMTATSSDTNLSFTNDCGVLRINATSTDVTVKRVSVDAVALNCGAGVDIATAKDFYIALPAGSYTDMTITFYSADGKKCSKVYNGTLTIEQNHIYPITFSDALSFSAPVLPAEYTRVSYIQSSGSQYINTGVAPVENTKVVLTDFNCLASDGWGVCFGITNNDGGDNSWMMRINGYNVHDLTSAIGNIQTSPYYNYNFEYTLGTTLDEVSLDKEHGLCVNGVQGTPSAINNAPVYCSMPIYLFGGNHGGSFWRGTSMRIGGCQIYEGNTLVRDFVAVKRNSDDAVGLYDFVTDTFFANQGSGVFTAGPVVQDSNPEITGTAPVLESAGRPNNECGWVQLWENGPKFATMFVGSTEADFSNCTSYSVAYCGGMYGWDSNTATTVWGANWTVATLADYRQMYAGFNTSSEKNMQLSPSIPNEGTNCIWEWMDGTAKQYVAGCTIQGWKVSGKGAYAANSIFFPLSGCNGDSRVGSIGVYYTATNGNRLYFENSGTSIDMQVYAGDRYHMLAKLVESNNGPAAVGLVGSAPVTVSDNVNANARTSCGWVLLWDGGPRWAEFNVGASATTYAGMTEYSFANTGGLYSFQGKSNLYPDVCGAISGDTATELWGTNWRTPTSDEEQALLRNCDFTYCDGSTVQYVTGCTLKGWKVTGRGGYAGNSIFLPLAGVSDQNSGNGVPHYYNDSQRPGNGGWYWAVDGNNRIYLNTTSQSIASHDSPHGCSVRAVLAK